MGRVSASPRGAGLHPWREAHRLHSGRVRGEKPPPIRSHAPGAMLRRNVRSGLSFAKHHIPLDTTLVEAQRVR